ncbi:MAG: hypothetical protein K6F42_00850 [Bacteroidales bacterium]|nr:hypothetical protein [Bacteroidales bacterium]
MNKLQLTLFISLVVTLGCILVSMRLMKGNKPEETEPYAPKFCQFEIIQTTCPEVSGLCLAPDGVGLLAASDEDGVYYIAPDGTTTPFYTEKNLDCEGVTVNPATGDVYYIVERKQELRRLRGPEYSQSELLFVFEDVGLHTNSGLEGVAWYRDDILFVGNQKRPSLLMQYSLQENRILSGCLTQTSEIADLCYDPVRDVLWVMDSDAYTINLCTTGGEILQSWPVPYIANAEAVCVDHARGCLWIGDDTTSRIFKMEFEGL